MAVDKLVDSTQLDADLTSVANAIRIKGGTSAQMAFPAGFVSAVQAIPTGTTPSGTKSISITQNGTTTEDVAAYANAEITVDVQGGGGGLSWDDLAIRNYTGAAVLETATTILNRAFENSKITSISAPNVSNISEYAFGNCKQLLSIYLPLANSSSATGWFDGCSALETVHLPCITNLWNHMFRNCTSLKTVVCPSITAINRPNSFNGDTALKTVDFGKSTSASNNLGGSFFANCSALNILIFRYKATPSLSNINCFDGTPFASGKSGGILYVPQSLISQYTQATNWSTILGYANNSIQAIEGSIYETQYADGTPIT